MIFKREICLVVLLMTVSLFINGKANFPSSLICPSLVVEAGPDQTICPNGSPVVLQGSVVGNTISTEWTPAIGLSDPFSLNPDANPPTTTIYTLTAQTPDDVNLITNGDFEAGNVGFSSGYTFIPLSNPVGLSNPATYTVITSPDLVLSTFPPCDDHTFGNGTGQMMVVNGDGSVGQSVWCQTIFVNPNTVYSLSAWVGGLVPISPAQLQFSVNGVLVGNVFNSAGTACGWEPFSATWNSAGASSAEICIVNQNGAGGIFGNDFLLDDIEVYGSCLETDVVTVTVLDAMINFLPVNQIDCNISNSCVTIDASNSTSGPGISYNWTSTTGAAISSGLGTSQIEVCEPGIFQLELTNTDPATGTDCTSIETIEVFDDGAAPFVPLISGMDMVCVDEIFQLEVDLQDGVVNYIWSFSPDVSLNFGQGMSIAAFEINTPGPQLICVEVENNCGYINQNCFNLTATAGPDSVLIAGDPTPCYGDTLMYSFPASGVSFEAINWIGSAGIEILSGQNTSSLEVTFTDTSTFNLCVLLTDDCGTSSSCLDIAHFAPDTLHLDSITCFVDSLLIGGVYIDSSGTYLATLVDIDGCDSLIIETNVEIIIPDTLFATNSSCNPNDIGVDTAFYGGLLSCDTMRITEIILSAVDTVELIDSSCFAADVGVFETWDVNISGCDSLTILTVNQAQLDTVFANDYTCDQALAGVFENILPGPFCPVLQIETVDYIIPDTIYITDTSCDLDSIGIFQFNDSNQLGCDSITYLTIDLITSDTIYAIDSTCNPSLVGEFTNIITSSPCPIVEITNVELIPPDLVFLTDTSCDPNDVGTFEYNNFNILGCDSTTFLTISLSQLDTFFISDTSCDPSLVGEFTTVVPGTPCDIVEITNVALLLPDTVFQTETSCDPNAIGIFEYNDFNQAGCDSTTYVTIDLVQQDTMYFTDETCDPMLAGEFINVVTGNPCDVVEITNVALLLPDTVYQTETSCDPNAIGIFEYNDFNQAGCDSITYVTIDLVQQDTMYFTDETCDPMLAGEFINVVTGNPCDVIEITTVDLLLPDTVFQTETSCDPNDIGIFAYNDFNQAGCDSTTYLTIDLVQQDTVYYTDETCDPMLSGEFINVVVGNPCDVVEITNVALLLPYTVFQTETSCDPNDIGIFEYNDFNQVGCDSTTYVTIDLVQQDTMYFTSETCDPTLAGEFTTVVMGNPCDVVEISTVTLAPADSVYLMEPTCVLANAGVQFFQDINQIGCDSFTWLTLNYVEAYPETINEILVCDVTQVDSVSAYEISSQGCDSLVTTLTIFDMNACGITVDIIVDTANCALEIGSFEITIIGGQAPFQIDWTNVDSLVQGSTNSFSNTTYVLGNLSPGLYELLIVDENGFSLIEEVFLPIHPAPDVELSSYTDFLGYDVSCETKAEAELVVSILSGAVPFELAWSDNVFTGMGVGMGTYSVTLTDGHGCTDIDTIVISAPPRISAEFNIQPTSCPEVMDGYFQIVNTSGGLGEIDFIAPNANQNANGHYENLAPGAYDVLFIDEYGCENDTTIMVPSGTPKWLTLGQDFEIDLGSSVTLNPIHDFINQFSIIDWEPILCDDCLMPEIMPSSDQTYTLTVVDEAGCSATDEILVRVNSNQSIFIPSAFSPNNDGQNDVFELFSNGKISEISSFSIYDRWGAILFQDKVEARWDGRFKQQLVNPGVYIYHLSYLDNEGKIVRIYGDITLIR